MGDYWRDVKAANQEDGERRRAQAMSEFPAAQQLAAEHGLKLFQRSDVHYQLSDKARSWVLNLYPGNQRLHWAKMRTRLDFENEWTLGDVVKACAEFDSNLKAVQ